MSTCPACGSAALEQFYEQDDVPVHSCRLFESREAAVAFARGSLRLAVCLDCGFVANTAYDPALQDYGIGYEETQEFSPHFRRWAEGLARDLIERYDVRGRDVLEIGCGKGSFLLALCDVGGNRGVGIDPSYVPERARANGVKFVRDYYSERYLHLHGDLVVCRHTLEHIQPVREFVQLVRRSLDDRLSTVVFFEVPETMRVLREAAFWDVYYEHCSYFTSGSLARLFRATEFEVVDVRLDYDDQYLLLDALPRRGTASASLPAEETVEEVVEAARAYGVRATEARAHWRAVLDEAVRAGRRVALWGSGSKAVSFLTTLHVGDEVACAVDVNPYRHGKYVPTTGHPIVAPEALLAAPPQLVIAMNGVYREEIRTDLERLGVQAELLTLDDRAAVVG